MPKIQTFMTGQFWKLLILSQTDAEYQKPNKHSSRIMSDHDNQQ